MQGQDEQLDGVQHTVGNLRQQAREMGEELDDQVMYVILLACRKALTRPPKNTGRSRSTRGQHIRQIKTRDQTATAFHSGQ